MANPDVTQKAGIYETLSSMNMAFAGIVTHIQTMQKVGALTAKYSRLFQSFAQEIQAELNVEVLQFMDSVEMADWARFGRVRDKWEKYLRGPQPKKKSAKK
jgi:hypothetical protein